MNRKAIDPAKVKNILIRVPNWVGDAVMALPALSAIREGFQGSQITLLGPASVLEIYQGNPLADHFIEMPKKKGLAGILMKWELAGKLGIEKFDLAILFQNAFEAALIARLAPIPVRVGYGTDGRSFLLTHAVKLPDEKDHQARYYLELAGTIPGVSSQRKEAPLFVTPSENRQAALALGNHGIKSGDLLIGINAGAAYGTAKRWSPERFASIGARLIREKKAKLILFGGAGERKLADWISKEIGDGVLNLAGTTSMRELMAFLSQCVLFITNDSGPMHLANALKVPLVAIFGPTDWVNTSPSGGKFILVRKGVACAPCLLRDCPVDHSCMNKVTEDMVYTAVEGQLDIIKPSASSSTPAVFLDRDGTINEDPGYVSREEDFKVFPFVRDSFLQLKTTGAKVFVVSNQSGIERGYFPIGLLAKLQVKLEKICDENSKVIQGYYYCFHRPETGCLCRKPQPGMIFEVLKKFPIDLANSFMVGDQMTDLELASRIGAKGILVLTGKGKNTLSQMGKRADLTPAFIAEDLLQASKWIASRIQEKLPGSAANGVHPYAS